MRRLARDDSFYRLKQSQRRAAVVLRVDDTLGFDENERDAGIVRSAIPLRVAGCIEQPLLPLRAIQCVDEIAIARQNRSAAHAHPLAGPLPEIRDVDVRIERELLELLALHVGHEPKIGAAGATLG